MGKMQKQADSVIFTDNLLIADDLKSKIKGYNNTADKRLDDLNCFNEPEQEPRELWGDELHSAYYIKTPYGQYT